MGILGILTGSFHPRIQIVLCKHIPNPLMRDVIPLDMTLDVKCCELVYIGTEMLLIIPFIPEKHHCFSVCMTFWYMYATPTHTHIYIYIYDMIFDTCTPRGKDITVHI